MKIAFFVVIEEDKKEYYKTNLSEHDLIFFDLPITQDNPPTQGDFDIISINVDCKITPLVIDSLPNLKFIAVRSTGFDNVDLEYVKSKKIQSSNVPAYGAHTVAEFTFGLILSLLRHIFEGSQRLKIDHKFSFSNLRGFDLNGKTIGVIGTGKIGGNVIKIAKGFKMNVLGFDVFQNQALSTAFDFNYISLEELLSQSDIVTLHVPYQKSTHHLINKDNITFMKKGSYLINTARGAVVDTQALFNALKSNHLAGVALDVLEDEETLKKIDSIPPNSVAVTN